MPIQTGEIGRIFQIEVQDESLVMIDMDLATDITIFWVTPGGFVFNPEFSIIGGRLAFVLDDMIQFPGTYFVEVEFTYNGLTTRTTEEEVTVTGQPWVPIRTPIVHYRIWQAPHGGTQWAGMTLQQLLDADVRVYDILYEIDMGRWKVFNGREDYDNLEYVHQTAGAVDHLLNIFGQVNIINMALGRLGQAPITDLNENKPGARLGQMYYRITVSEIMAAYNWSSAIVRQSLSLVPDEISEGVPNPERNTFTGYQLQYYTPVAPRPVRVLHLFTNLDGAYQRSDTPFRLEGDYLYTNLEHAGLVYVGDYSASTGRLDPFVIELVVLRLAARMAFAITSSPAMTNQLMAEYREKMAEAQFADSSRAREDTSRDIFPSPRSNWTEVE